MLLKLPNSNHDISLTEINKKSALELLQQNFLDFLTTFDADLKENLINSYQNQIYDSKLTTNIASILEDYINIIFDLNTANTSLINSQELAQNIYKTFIFNKVSYF